MARAQVANLFGVSPNVVGDAVKRFEETGTCKNRRGQGRSRSATDSGHVEEARQHLSESLEESGEGGGRRFFKSHHPDFRPRRYKSPFE